MFGRNDKAAARRELREAKADLNRRFNNRDTDPNDPEYLAANDRVARAERALRG